MKALILRFIFSLMVMLFSATALAQANAASELTHLLSQYKTYQADFKQSTSYSTNQKPDVTTGRLYMERPGKFRWEVDKPMKQIVIADGHFMWIYDVELQQVTKQKLTKSQSNNPAVLLSGNVSELIKQYVVSKVRIHDAIWYQLKPLSSQSSFLLIRMRFVNKRLSAIWVKNNLDQTSLFEFTNIELNKVLSAKLFNFKPPPGVDVLQ